MLQYLMTGGDHNMEPRLDLAAGSLRFHNTDRHNFADILDVTADGFLSLSIGSHHNR